MEIENLKALIKQRKITHKYLHDITGFSLVYISKIMNGHRKASPRFLKLVSYAIEQHIQEEKKWLLEKINELDRNNQDKEIILPSIFENIK